jgi:hypothetical protein
MSPENLYDIFVKCVVGELVMLRDDQVQKYTRINMLSKFRSIIDNLRGLSSSLLLKILVARQFPQDGKSDLHLLLETGKAVPVQTWKTIGNGDTVANPLVQDF